MSEYFGKIDDLPTITEGHFIENAEKRNVFGPERFWKDYVMRCFTLSPGAASPSHSHAWPHYAVCIDGVGKFKVGEETALLENGVWVYVPGGVTHNFRNTGEDSKMVLLCVVPKEGDVNPMLIGC
jgi:quercetin dioxygenase-like cupin family protein